MNKIISEILKPQGYKKHSTRWYKITEEMIPFLRIDSAWYGEDKFFNVGAVVREVNSAILVPSHDNEHISKRIGVMEQSGAFTEYNKNENLSDADRERILKESLVDIVLPLLLKLENKKGAHDLIWSDGGFIVWGEARPYLDLPPIKKGVVDPWKKQP